MVILGGSVENFAVVKQFMAGEGAYNRGKGLGVAARMAIADGLV